MKAIVFTQYGSPDVLQLTEVEKREPKEGAVLIKVYAAAANPVDWHRMRGKPFLVRLSDGFRKPKNPRLGSDVAGRVEVVGNGVSEFQPGDEVYGCGLGAFAEYAGVRATALAPKPANLSFEQAAAIPIVAFTALQGLRDTGHLQAGQTVLVNGASGGVGTLAVQLAKCFGAEVTGVCSSRNVELVRSLGADHVIDYTREDFTRTGQRYDLIYDAVGNRSAFAIRRALKPGGTCVIAGFSTLRRMMQTLVVGAVLSKMGDRKIRFMGLAKPNREDLLFMNDLLEAGKVFPVIDRRYPLSETAEAIRYLEQGHARGKVIITVEPEA